MSWGDGPADHYQRWSDEKHEEMVKAIANLPKLSGATLGEDDPVIAGYVAWIVKFVKENPEKRHHFYYQNGIECGELLRVPDRFVGMF